MELGLTAGGLIREHEQELVEAAIQKEALAAMPAKEGFGYDHPSLPAAPSGPSRGRTAVSSPAISNTDKGKAKRRKTPEYTDSEEDSD